MTIVEAKRGEVISGLLLTETASVPTLRTTTDQVVLAKADLTERTTNEKSLMPEALLESLNDREQIELLKFPTANRDSWRERDLSRWLCPVPASSTPSLVSAVRSLACYGARITR